MGLLFSTEDLDTLRARVRLPLFTDFWQSQLNADVEKDRALLESKTGDQRYADMLRPISGILKREAFVFAITGDEKRADLARLAIKRALSFPYWATVKDAQDRPIGIQGGPELLISICLAFDWLGGFLTEEDHEQILPQIGDKGCQACYWALQGMLHLDDEAGWKGIPECGDNTEHLDLSRWPTILSGTNLQAVPMTGLAMGAMVLAGKDGRVDDWVDMVVKTYHELAKAIERDGSYHEGVSYWRYATMLLALTVEVMARKADLDLYDRINYVGMMEFALGMRMPHRDHPDGGVNFGDAGGIGCSDVGLWIARRSRDGLAQHTALNSALNHSLYSLIWYDPEVKELSPTEREHFKHFDLDWIVARTGYETDDLVVAMRSGGPGNHEHADRNSVLLKAHGEVLLADVKRPPYSYTDPGWLLRTSPAHNTVLIDGKGHQYHDGEEGTNPSLASARIIREGDRGGYLFWTSDATPAYVLINEDVECVSRTVFLFPEFPALIVADKLIKSVSPSVFAARWHIENKDGKGKGCADGTGFCVERPGAKFVARCAGSETLGLTSEQLPVPQDKGVFPYIEVALERPTREACILLVGVPMKRDENDPEIGIDRTDEGWAIRVKKGTSNVEALIIDRGRYPTIQVDSV